MFVNLRRVLAETADNRNVPDDAKAAARARIASLDRAIAAVDGEAPLQSALGALRSRAGRARKAVLAGRIYHDGVPEEVATAFPDSDWRLGAGARG
jgi:hypothetical protein